MKFTSSKIQVLASNFGFFLLLLHIVHRVTKLFILSAKCNVFIQYFLNNWSFFVMNWKNWVVIQGLLMSLSLIVNDLANGNNFINDTRYNIWNCITWGIEVVIKLLWAAFCTASHRLYWSTMILFRYKNDDLISTRSLIFKQMEWSEIFGCIS